MYMSTCAHSNANTHSSSPRNLRRLRRLVDVNETLATTICLLPMPTKPLPRQHFPSRCQRNLSRSIISPADVNETSAAATYLRPMSTKPQPQQQFSNRCPRNLCHINISSSDVHESLATVTWLNPVLRASLTASTRLFPSPCVLALAIHFRSTASFLASAGIA